ncbi:aminobenzoyl-glutamate utilization protein B [Breoghania corrubedonensis]|uniref:Aminobenzoyl-glutamate utilization protein B n=1 Tax=Breoghania corrubedonensis TaxID=665038 RepID=A0A2T5V8Z3_9HYPH|nr:amidohydrolase [Breoghania corrubedonensis]PTW60210.1 aminobenzoyl-glutamate utilization protein B [Breoghania corrubedonensis]
MSNKNSDPVWAEVDDRREAYAGLADRIWEKPELNFAEAAACAEHATMLRAEGFEVKTGIAGLPTAVMGEAGTDGPVIAILGEYDALPGLSQEAGVAEHRPIVEGGNGHGCGHNLLGAGSMLAAAALKAWLEETGTAGRVRYYGCPAEEGGSAKGFMVREGLFDDVDIAICWHPAPLAAVNPPISLACNEILFEFDGKASHASSSPELGRSALDAVELMNVGVNYLREHMPSTARIHYAVTDTGGTAPNVVQAHAAVRYLIRARELDELVPLVERVRNVARGAALMTETRMSERVVSGDANLIGNTALEELMHAELVRLGPPRFDDEDRDFAKAIRATLSAQDIRAAFSRFGVEPRMDVPLADDIMPLCQGQGSSIGSTDVGTVSWVVPTVQMRGATCAIGTPAHSWQLVAQGKSGIAHKGMTHAAKVMAATAKALFEDPAKIAAAKADFARRREGRPFVNPLPDDVAPDLPVAAE